MRLFTALELNSKVIMNLTELVSRLRPFAPIRWVHPQNMHLTLKYIGEWPEQRLDEIVEALSTVRLKTGLNVPLAGLGFFPNARSPRVFWVGAEATPGLRQLHSQIDAVLAPLGVAPEVRPYQPHLTLGRLKPGVSLKGLDEAIEELPSRDFGTISPEQFGLFDSSLTPAGPVYRKLAEFPITSTLAEELAPHSRSILAGR